MIIYTIIVNIGNLGLSFVFKCIFIPALLSEFLVFFSANSMFVRICHNICLSVGWERGGVQGGGWEMGGGGGGG